MSDLRSKRVQRVERELLHELSLVLHQRLNEPLPCLVSISAVEIQPDLRKAKVHFRLVGGKLETQAAQEILDAHHKVFQTHVAENLKTKFCPVLRFEYGVAPQLDDVDRLFEDLYRPRWGQW